MSSSLDGKVALVTGASSGIGEALADALAGRGARVLGVGRDALRLDRVAARWRGRFVPLQSDLADPQARAKLTEDVWRSADRVDILVNNAAEVVYQTPLGLGAAGFSRLMEINVAAALDLTRATAERMVRGSSVLNVSSVTARFLPQARFASYAVSKAALDHLTAALRLELEPRGIHVCLLSLGLVDTPVYDKVAGFEGMRERLAAQVPAWLEPRDVAEAALWMLERPPPVVATELVLMPAGQAR
jgi:NAD(P)-dependent dehydrogenase (short-subunit alcohol dehydrogenase family)